MDKFRVLFNPTILDEEDCRFFTEPVGSYEMANTQLDTIANYTLHLHNTSLMQDYSNAGIVQQLVDGEWIDFDEENP